MSEPSDNTEYLLSYLRNGNKGAKDRLIAHTMERLRLRARRMLKSYPDVHSREDTDDVLQRSLIRLCRALEKVQPESRRHFYRLATKKIRQALLDLAAYYLRRQGLRANHHSDANGQTEEGQFNPLDNHTDEPLTLMQWSAFHKRVAVLPKKEREVFEHLWYQGLKQNEAATLVGVSLRTVKRRWLSVRLKLAKCLPQ